MGIFEKMWPKENPEKEKKDDNELIIDPNTRLVETKKLKEAEEKFDKKGRSGEEWREQP